MAINEREVNFVTFTDKTLEIIESKARNTAELRTKQIIETALDAVITTNSKGEIQDWNPKAEQILVGKHPKQKEEISMKQLFLLECVICIIPEWIVTWQPVNLEY